MLKRFLADEEGATAIEYSMICAGIALVIIAALNSIGHSLVAMLTTLLTAFG